MFLVICLSCLAPCPSVSVNNQCSVVCYVLVGPNLGDNKAQGLPMQIVLLKDSLRILCKVQKNRKTTTVSEATSSSDNGESQCTIETRQCEMTLLCRVRPSVHPSVSGPSVCIRSVPLCWVRPSGSGPSLCVCRVHPCVSGPFLCVGFIPLCVLGPSLCVGFVPLCQVRPSESMRC